MIEAGLAGAAALWVFRWAGRGAEAFADGALGGAVDRLVRVVREKLGADPALDRLDGEAASGADTPTDRTRRRVADALQDAAEDDPDFARTLADALRAVTAADSGTAVGGDVNVTASGAGSVAAQVIHGDVTVGQVPRPPQPEPPQG